MLEGSQASGAADKRESAGTNRRWHDDYPEIGTAPVPIEPYISPEFFELERERVFRHAWLNVGRVEQAANPGDFFVKDIAVCRTSILVVRDKDGRLGAFHNVCSHRSNKLVWENHGNCRAFQCRFHGWSYRLDGRLSGVPGAEGFFDLDRVKLALKPVALDVWEGFVFVNLDPAPAQSLAEYLGAWAEELNGYPFTENCAQVYRWSVELNCNWKLIKDAFKEAYHVAFMHKRTLQSYAGGENPLGKGLEFKLFPMHHRGSFGADPAYKPTPLETLAYRFGSSIIPGNAPARQLPAHELPVGANPTRHPNWVIDVNGVFPNFMVDLLEGSVVTYHMWPIKVDRTLWEVTQYFPRPTSAGQRFSQEHGRLALRNLLMEDSSTLEKSQSVLASGARTHFTFQDEEILLRHDNKVLMDFIRAGGIPTTGRGNPIQAQAAAHAG